MTAYLLASGNRCELPAGSPSTVGRAAFIDGVDGDRRRDRISLPVVRRLLARRRDYGRRGMGRRIALSRRPNGATMALTVLAAITKSPAIDQFST